MKKNNDRPITSAIKLRDDFPIIIRLCGSSCSGDIMFDVWLGHELADDMPDSYDGGCMCTDENHTHYTARDFKSALEMAADIVNRELDEAEKQEEANSERHKDCKQGCFKCA